MHLREQEEVDAEEFKYRPTPASLPPRRWTPLAAGAGGGPSGPPPTARNQTRNCTSCLRAVAEAR